MSAARWVAGWVRGGSRAPRIRGHQLTVTVESASEPVGCRSCGVVARGHGRVGVGLVDAPAMGRPVRIVWAQAALGVPGLGVSGRLVR